ncbi:putative Low molecular weight protein-tyrosine-phosphatase [Zostera marina]|uniref:acid phosphatase n=1 Tax=Zostera marina TaxID=29655 RepID=A0A0K9PTW3_ZOSMR|nr:putative Low molecular weight protein-tyrosine-phosphatase [Zostera marina]
MIALNLFSTAVVAATAPKILTSRKLRIHHSPSSNLFNYKFHSVPLLSTASRSPAMASSVVNSTSSTTENDSLTVSSYSEPYSILFVCLGNICRSPAAEGVFRSLVSERGLDSRFNIDSAGTIGYHEGNPADPRMRAAAKKRGIEITSNSRPIRPSDFSEFDLILAMDKQNKEDILSAYQSWSFKDTTFPKNAQKKVKLMCSYCKKHSETQVPDPYYGGPQGFEKVLDILEDACVSLLDSVLSENK